METAPIHLAYGDDLVLIEGVLPKLMQISLPPRQSGVVRRQYLVKRTMRSCCNDIDGLP